LKQFGVEARGNLDLGAADTNGKNKRLDRRGQDLIDVYGHPLQIRRRSGAA